MGTDTPKPARGADDKQRAALVLPSIVSEVVHDAARLEESRDLLNALDCEIVFDRHVKLRTPNARTLFGEGILDEMTTQVKELDCDLMVVDGHLTPTQQRNLEAALGCKVIDRTALILEIFGLRARTAEGKLQVEYARQQYERTRLVRTWTHLERQRGGRGFLAGPGETQLEADKRMIDRALGRLKRQLDDVRKTRGLQRAGRKRSGTPIIALIGYTNAGKSTLFNALTQGDALVKDMVFATLDPTIRQFILPNGRKVAIVDTVGFITDLPTELVDSFRATLEEVLAADLLLHVRDISGPKHREQAQDVRYILGQLEADYKTDLPPIVEVWNKSDQLDADALEALLLASTSQSVFAVSALKKTGLDPLVAHVESAITQARTVYEITLNASDAKARAWLFENGEVLDESANDMGQSEMSVQLELELAGKFGKLFPDMVEALMPSE